MSQGTIRLEVTFVDPGLNASKLSAFKREAMVTLSKQPGIEAQDFESASVPGAKGDLLSVGSFVLHLLGSGGAVVVFLNGLKAYFLRNQSLTVDVKRADGATFTVKAENLNKAAIERTSAQLSEFLQG